MSFESLIAEIYKVLPGTNNGLKSTINGKEFNLIVQKGIEEV